MGSCPQGNIQLVYGSTNREGIIEICVNGSWGAICSNQWDSREAQVVCRQLGHNTVLGMYIQKPSESDFGSRPLSYILL